MEVIVMSSETILTAESRRQPTTIRLQPWTPFFVLCLLALIPSGPFPVPSAQAEKRPNIIIDEYEIRLNGEISPGKQTLHVNNAGTMLHEVVIFKLKEGTTASDFKAIISRGGSLRKVGKMKGNMPPIEAGITGKVTATFETGQYLLLCFQVDDKTQQPHFMVGMLHEFTIT